MQDHSETMSVSGKRLDNAFLIRICDDAWQHPYTGGDHFLRTRRDGGGLLREQHDAAEAVASRDARDGSFG